MSLEVSSASMGCPVSFDVKNALLAALKANPAHSADFATLTLDTFDPNAYGDPSIVRMWLRLEMRSECSVSRRIL